MKRLLPLLFCMVMAITAKAQFCGPYTFHAPIIMSGVTGVNVTGDSVSSVTLTNCTNVVIHRCKMANNTTGIAISLFNCHNVVIDSCYAFNDQQGFIAQSCTSVQIVNNYLQNIIGAPYPLTYHPIQFNNVTGSGNKIIGNKIEEVGVPYSHDQVSVYQSTGLPGDSILVWNNTIRGGQRILHGGFTGSNNGANGITAGDSGGGYISVRGNKVIDCGYGGIQVDGHGSNISCDHNYIYSDNDGISWVGLSFMVSGGGSSYSGIFIGYNHITWTNVNNKLQNSFSSVTAPPGWTTNTPPAVADPLANAGMIPTPQVTPCVLPVIAPVLSYSGTPYTFTAGTTIGTLNIINSGGAVTSSYTVSPSLPAGLVLNASTGQITGTPTVASSATNYVISGSNSAGTGNATINITVNPPPVALPSFIYSPSTNIYTIPTPITPLMPISTGGAIVSYMISPSLPSGLFFNTTTGVISGTPLVVSPLTAYTVTGFNSSGAGHTTVNIQVNPNPIIAPNISYQVSSIISTYGSVLSPMVPLNTGSAATWSVSPALPPQCSINTTTGVITGTFTVVQSIQSYTVTATNASGSSHTTVKFTVNKAVINLYANNLTKLQNTPNPTLSYTAINFLNGDNAGTAFTTQPSMSTTALTNSPPGNYTITISGAVSNNYSMVYHSGVLTVLVHPHKIHYRKVFVQP